MTELDTAVAFFHACETARGWEGCAQFAEPDAAFHSSTTTYDGMTTLEQYCDQIRQAFTTTFVGSDYRLRAAAYDADTRTALLLGTSLATHTGPGGPVPPTERTAEIPFVYVIEFADSGRIRRLEKVFDQQTSTLGLGWPS